MKIYKVSRPSILEDGIYRFLQDEQLSWQRTNDASNADETVELAGRLCYMSFGNLQFSRTNSEYIQNLIDQGHESVLEHATWSFIITGVSRGFTHQIVRHRVGFSFSQLSQQYFNESTANMVEPTIVSKYKEIREKWKGATTASQKAYTELLAMLDELETDSNALSLQEKKEVKRLKYSAARSVLPNATESKIFITANARALRHFFNIRGSIPGDEEMRIVASELLKQVCEDSVSLFSDFYISYLADDSPIVLRNNSKGSKTEE